MCLLRAREREGHDAFHSGRSLSACDRSTEAAGLRVALLLPTDVGRPAKGPLRSGPDDDVDDDDDGIIGEKKKVTITRSH